MTQYNYVELLAILKQLGIYTRHLGTYKIQNIPFVSLARTKQIHIEIKKIQLTF